MQPEIMRRGAVYIIGREGSTGEGEGFIARLWDAANSAFGEIAPLALYDGCAPAGIWGAMSDMGRRMLPWEDGFTRGLYLAGAEVRPDAQPPEGWTRWVLPARQWLLWPVAGDAGAAFREGLEYIERNGLQLAGAACDYTVPARGASYVAFPIERANGGD